METIDFPEIFEEYKSGFSTGLIDFIINPEIDINTIPINKNDPSMWQLGYRDAINHYKKEAIESFKKGLFTIDLGGIFTIICELYTLRIGQINKEYDLEIPAFILIKTPNTHK
ncbi:MAG: hypothetical protein VZS44_08915 [Bacilli bacterium]|nr:hypothetical protein [Bacilli bacterium]